MSQFDNDYLRGLSNESLEDREHNARREVEHTLNRMQGARVLIGPDDLRDAVERLVVDIRTWVCYRQECCRRGTIAPLIHGKWEGED